MSVLTFVTDGAEARPVHNEAKQLMTLTNYKLIVFSRFAQFFIIPVVLIISVPVKTFAQPVAVANNSGPVCAGNPVNLSETGGSAVTWNWTTSGNAIFSSSTVQNPVVTGAADGEVFTVTITDINGNTANASTTVSIFPLPAVTLNPAGPFCADGAAIQLSGSPPGGTFGGTGVTLSGLFTPSQAGAGSHLITYTYKDANGCTSSAEITILVNALPVAGLTSSDADNIFCTGTSVTFSATGGTNYNFRVGGVSVQNGTAASYTSSSILNGQAVDVIVMNASGCSATSGAIVNLVNPLPFIVISGVQCSPNLLTFSFTATVSSGTVTCTSGIVTSSGNNTWSISSIPAGTDVTVTVTDANGCITSLPVSSPVCSCPFVQAPASGGDKSYCQSSPIPALTVSVSAGVTADWYNSPAGGALLQAGALSYIPAAAGTYYAQARNTTTGCTSSSRTAVTLIMNPLPVPVLSSSDADNKFCAGTSVTFTAGGGTVYNFRVNGTSVQNGSSSTYTTNTLTNNQTVDVLVTGNTGCSAVSQGITNTVSPVPVAGLTSSDADNTFCEGTSVTFTATGGTSYNFRLGGISVQNGNSAIYSTSSITNGQIINVVVTNSSGCSAISSSITNTVNPLPLMILSSPQCSADLTTYSLSASVGSGSVTSTSGTVTNTGSNIWTITGVRSGINITVTATDLNGCSSSVPVTAPNCSCPVVQAPLSGGNKSFCSPGPVPVISVSAGTGETVDWYNAASGGTLLKAGSLSYSPAGAGTYYAMTRNLLTGCTSSVRTPVTVSVNPLPQPVITSSDADSTFCAGTSVTFRASGGISYNFFVDNTSVQNSTSTSYTTSSLTDGQKVSVIVTNSSGCSAISKKIMNRVLQAPAANAGPDGSECDFDHIMDANSVTDAGVWTKVSGPGNSVFSPSVNRRDAKVTVDKKGIYQFTWTVSNGSCQASDLVTIVFRELPPVQAGKDTVVCKGSHLILNGTGNGSFIWSPDSLVNNAFIADPVASPGSTTVFKVILTDQYGCSNSDEVKVSVKARPVADAGKDQILKYTFTTTLGAKSTADGENGKWSVLAGSGDFSDKTSPVTRVSGLSVNDNRFLWTVDNSICPVSSDTVLIRVEDLVVPSLITPNMDGKNDYFILNGLESLGRTDLTVFNRWGAQVYKNPDYDNTWNGTDNNGNTLPDDTYFYVIRSQDGKSLSSFIVIRR